MTRILIPLITLGLFAALASYAWGRSEPGHRQVAARHAAMPVVLTRYATLPDCVLDWLCLVQQAERVNPAKHRKGHHNG